MWLELPSVLNPKIMSLLQLLYEGFCFSKALTPVKVIYPTSFYLAKFCSAAVLQACRSFPFCTSALFSWSKLWLAFLVPEFPTTIRSHNFNPIARSGFYFSFTRAEPAPHTSFMKPAVAYEVEAHETVSSALETAIQGGL